MPVGFVATRVLSHGYSRVGDLMLDPESRRYLRNLFDEQDRLLHEHRQWTARREAEAEREARESEPEGILYREQQNNEPAPAAESSGLGLFGDARDHVLAQALGYQISRLRRERRDELEDEVHKIMNAIARMVYPGEAAERAVHELESRLTQLEAQVRQIKSRNTTAVAKAEPEVIELLPNWRKNRDVA